MPGDALDGMVEAYPREPLTVCCFKWGTQFNGMHVNVLANMVRRWCRLPYEFVCITDSAIGIRPGIRTIPLWPDLGDLPSPAGVRFPSCYRRLKLFSPEAGELVGKRIVCLDLDTVITGDVTPLWDRPEDFVIWGNYWCREQGRKGIKQRFNGSMFLLRAGTRTSAWTEFRPDKSPSLATRRGHRGSDQGWLSYHLGDEATWGRADGVYSWRIDIEPNSCQLPADARIVFWHGKTDPWDRLNVPWVKEHWR